MPSISRREVRLKPSNSNAMKGASFVSLARTLAGVIPDGWPINSTLSTLPPR